MHKVILAFSCFLLIACSGEKEISVPETVLSKKQMVAVFIDIHLLEAMLNSNSKSADKVSIGNRPVNFDVLKKNNINKKQYDESFKFYSQHPNLLNEIYLLVLNDLSKMQAEVMNKN